MCTYTITIAPGSLQLQPAYANLYVLRSANGSYTIAPATLIVQAIDQTRFVGEHAPFDPRNPGEASPHLHYDITGYAWHEGRGEGLRGEPSETTTATEDSAPGTYPITVGPGTLRLVGRYAADYTITHVGATLTITPASGDHDGDEGHGGDR